MHVHRLGLRLIAGLLALFLVVSEARSVENPYQFQLENGLKVILQENRAAPVVALQVWVKVGSADEREDEAGMCHFIEHMIFKGTEKRKVGEMAKEIESLGGSINAYTSYDHTVYHITIASRYADIALDILADAIQNSVFDASELEKEREVILEEIRMGEDDPSRRLFRQTMTLLGKKFPKTKFEELAKAAGCAYVATVTPTKPRRLDQMVKRAILISREVGPTFIRIATVCQTNYKLSPIEGYNKAKSFEGEISEYFTEEAEKFIKSIEKKSPKTGSNLGGEHEG